MERRAKRINQSRLKPSPQENLLET